MRAPAKCAPWIILRQRDRQPLALACPPQMESLVASPIATLLGTFLLTLAQVPQIVTRHALLHVLLRDINILACKPLRGAFAVIRTQAKVCHVLPLVVLAT